MNILTVEDDPVAQLVLESALKSLGHTVTLVADGMAAWLAFQAQPARVIVSDWRMPRMDGLELCRRVRAQPGDYVYFILLTNLSATGDNLEVAMAAGIDDFLTKPVNVQELRVRLHVADRILTYATQVKQLESFLPICGYCKKIRDGICPDCYNKQVVPMFQAAGIAPPPPPPVAGKV